MRPDDLICSRVFRETVLNECPALRTSRRLRRLFAYLAFGTWRCRHTGNLMIPTEVLAHLEEREHLLEHGNYVGERFLSEFSEQVARISYNKAVWVAELCRTVRWVEWPQVVREAIEGERLGLRNSGSGEADERVFFTDGRRATQYAKMYKREKLREEAMASISRAGCPDAERLLRYLNTRRSNRYTKLITNLDTAIAVALRITDDRAREHALDTLRAIREQPTPFYQASPRGRTVRVFPLTTSLLTLKSCVRRVLTPNWIDLDLRSAQAAIVARDWRIASLQALLESQGSPSLWGHLLNQLGVPEERHAAFKPALKDSLYATMFGSEERNICWHLSHDMGEQGLGRRFLNLSLMQDILAARQRLMAEVIKKGGTETIYGTWVPLPTNAEPEKAVRSVLAQCAQAAEMKLLAPVIDLATEWDGRSSGFDITLWQHDGFSFVPDKQEDARQWTVRLQNAVQTQADHLGYATRLEEANPACSVPDDAVLNVMQKKKRYRRSETKSQLVHGVRESSVVLGGFRGLSGGSS